MNNCDNYLSSQVGKTLEKIKLAFLSGKPIVYLLSSEMDVVKEIIYSDTLFPASCKNIYKKKETVPILFGANGDAFFNDQKNNKKPQLFVYFADGSISESQVGARSLNVTNINENLLLFERVFLGLGTKIESNPKDDIELAQKSLIIVVTPTVPSIPPQIANYAEIVRVEYMEDWELLELLRDCVVDTFAKGGMPDSNELDNYVNILLKYIKGLSKSSVKQLFNLICLTLGGAYFPNVEDDRYKKLIRLIQNEKSKSIENSSILKLIKSKEIKKASGLGRLEGWLNDIVPIVRDYERMMSSRLLEAPKGVLVAGVPGSGKSLMAKYSAQLLGLPLIRMDMGDVMDKWVGSSEQRMTQALEQVEAMSPCVLWIDEIEKSFAGSNGNSNSEVTKRLFGKFLTWMQEKENRNVCCFVFATANNISKLPPELFRNGRFDAKFFTFMPSAKECGEIFESLIKDQNEKFKKIQSELCGEEILHHSLFHLSINADFFVRLLEDKQLCLNNYIEIGTSVSRQNKFFTGADIESVLKMAKEIYLNDNCKFSDNAYRRVEFEKCLRSAIEKTKTYGETNLYDIASCFACLAVNNFSQASNDCILPLEGYDELKYILETENKSNNKAVLYMCDESSLTSDYDRCLCRAIKNTLNGMSDRIIEENKQSRL